MTGRRPKFADHQRMMRLVEQLSPATRARISARLDGRYHELTGAPRDPECCGAPVPDAPQGGAR